jgi:hypothetical protein
MIAIHLGARGDVAASARRADSPAAVPVTMTGLVDVGAAVLAAAAAAPMRATLLVLVARVRAHLPPVVIAAELVDLAAVPAFLAAGLAGVGHRVPGQERSAPACPAEALPEPSRRPL